MISLGSETSFKTSKIASSLSIADKPEQLVGPGVVGAAVGAFVVGAAVGAFVVGSAVGAAVGAFEIGGDVG
jgi:hypothetical protein